MPQETRLGPELSLGLRPFHRQGMACLPTSSQGGKQRKGASHYRELGRKPKRGKDGFFTRGNGRGKRFCKGGTDLFVVKGKGYAHRLHLLSFCAIARLQFQRLSPTSCCSCSSSPQSSRSGAMVGGRGGRGEETAFTARCLLGIVVLLALEGDPTSCHVNNYPANSKTHLALRGSRPALTAVFLLAGSSVNIPAYVDVDRAEAQSDSASELN